MSRPRQVLPNSFYLITRRCTQRQFLLRPDAQTNDAFTYCLAEAAQRFQIDVVVTVAESNHHHTVIFDRHGRCPQFVEHFHNLVEHATHWPGVNGYVDLLADRPLRARRPRHFFSQDGMMPAEVELRLVIPPELGPPAAVIDELRTGVEAVERAMREHRAKTGTRVIGRRRILDQSWRSSPTSFEPRRTLRPRFAGGKDVRIPALLAVRAVLSDYRDARKSWLAGVAATFPLGTYWLARFAPVTVVPIAAT